MMPGALYVALGTTCVDYSAALNKPRVPQLEQVLAEAMSHATKGAAERAQEKMAESAGGKEVILHTTTLVSHVTDKAILVTCVLMYEVKLLILDAPTL